MPMKNVQVSADSSIFDYVRMAELKAILGQSHSTSYRGIASGVIPEPVELGPNRKGWPRYEAEAINRSRLAGLPDDAVRKIVLALTTARKDLATRAPFEVRAFVAKLIEEQLAEAA
jgi:predicted DNA-binding transcriptional regulator AlpA